MLSKASPTEVLRWQEMICKFVLLVYIWPTCAPPPGWRSPPPGRWGGWRGQWWRAGERAAATTLWLRETRESVGVGWKLESELPLRPDVPCVLSPSLRQGLHHSTLYCTTDYCTTEKLELPFCCLEWGVVNIISILIPENTSKTKVTGRQRSYLLVLSARNRWFSKQ